MTEEQWRPIPGYEDLYEVSDRGQVKSLPRPRTPGGLLKPHISRTGYLALSLCREGRPVTRQVHRLVAAAFIGPRPEGQEVRHLDGDKLNPALGNLAYGTSSQNKLDKRAHGTDHEVNKTHCPQGHPYDAENTYVIPTRPTSRKCRACGRARGQAYYRARKNAAAYHDADRKPGTVSVAAGSKAPNEVNCSVTDDNGGT